MLALIQRTGFNEYNTAIFPKGTPIDESNYDMLEYLQELLNVDFICVMKKGSITFKHYTKENNLDFILENGLVPKEVNGIYDIGYGIYCIEDGNTDGLDNIIDMYSDYPPSLKLLKVTKGYSGVYRECIAGENHSGYICLLNVPIKLNKRDYTITTVREEF